MSRTKINWSEFSWNPIVGCSHVSAGCDNCYAEKMAYRLACMDMPFYDMVQEEGQWNGRTEFVKSALDKPLHWKKPRKIFVGSMGDLFHKSVPFGWIDRVWDIMHLADWHTYQILTKRPKVLYEYCEEKQRGTWPKNIWLGVTAENQAMADKRIPILLQIPAAKRFVSIEPMLGEVNLEETSIGQSIGPCDQCGKMKGSSECGCCMGIPSLDWVIVGCESGPKRRECKIKWVRSIVEQCKEAGVKIFVKQLEVGGKVTSDMEQFPKTLQVRQFPKNKGKQIRQYPKAD